MSSRSSRRSPAPSSRCSIRARPSSSARAWRPPSVSSPASRQTDHRPVSPRPSAFDEPFDASNQPRRQAARGRRPRRSPRDLLRRAGGIGAADVRRGRDRPRQGDPGAPAQGRRSLRRGRLLRAGGRGRGARRRSGEPDSRRIVLRDVAGRRVPQYPQHRWQDAQVRDVLRGHGGPDGAQGVTRMIKQARRIAVAALSISVVCSVLLAAGSVADAACGGARWSVQTASDPAAGRIDLAHVVATSVEEMTAKGAPATMSSESRIEPDELNVSVVNAVLTSYKREDDGDYYAVLSSGGTTMVAEFPDPACVSAPSP